MIAGICTFPRLPCPCTTLHVMLNLTSTWVCNTNFETWMRGCGAVWLGIVFEDAAVVSAVVLRRPTKEYTHPYSMMHRRSAYCWYWGLASLSSITCTLHVSHIGARYNQMPLLTWPRTQQHEISTFMTYTCVGGGAYVDMIYPHRFLDHRLYSEVETMYIIPSFAFAI